MDTRIRARTGMAIALGLVALATAVLGLAVVYGLAAEYGAGSLAELNALVVAPPVLLAAFAALALPRARTRWRMAAVLGTATVMVVGGVLADAAGAAAKQDRLVQDSRAFGCNNPNAEVRVPARVDRVWRNLPRRGPLYGPIEGSTTSCVAAVVGEGRKTYLAYTEALRDLDGWQVRIDRSQRFVMIRDGIQVTVLLQGQSEQMTTIAVSTQR